MRLSEGSRVNSQSVSVAAAPSKASPNMGLITYVSFYKEVEA